MDTAIKALETVYQGTRFRSRTEARWAVFFDALGLRWLYEPEGYDLGGGVWYLPDFFLPDLHLVLEIKPPLVDVNAWPEDAAFQKICKLKEQLIDKQIVMLCGVPGPVTTTEPYVAPRSYQGFVVGDSSRYWCECVVCGALGIQYEGRADRNTHKPNCSVNRPKEDRGHSFYSTGLLTAYAAACSARFDGRRP